MEKPAPMVFEAIGTHWQIDIDQPLSPQKRGGLLQAILDRIAVYDKHYSRFRDDSLVSEMSRTPGTYIMPDDLPPMMDVYRRAYDATGGKFTPLIGRTMEEAGYDAKYTLKSGTLHQPPAWDDAIAYAHPSLTVKQPVLLDVGAAGKGYLIDIVGDLLWKEGIRSFTINAGQDILYESVADVPLRVGLENPADITQAIGIATITDGSICGSSGNRRRWESFHHIIDPSTLTSPQHILACWTIAQTALVADAMSTALFFAEPQALTGFDFDYLILRPDFTVEGSANFPAELFT